jgi:NADPH:quinone reductase-like Zn-dependent oxidoreductase
VVPDFQVGFKPKNLTHDEAASLPMVGLTTIQSFEDFKNPKDKKVFITGAFI